MRKLLLMLMAVFLVSAFAFGNGKQESQNTETESTESQKETTEITFLCSSVKPYDTAMPKMIQKFESENPNIKVKLEQLPTKNIWQMVEVKLGAKESVPDVVFTDAPLVTAYAVKGYLEPLDSYFSSDELSQYLDVPLKACTYNGKLYAAPFQNSSQLLYYNTDMFDAAGLKRLSKDPADRLTWSEVVDLAKKLTIDSDNDGTPEVFGLGISQISRPYQMLTMPESLGGKAISDDGLSVKGLLTDSAWKQSCQFISDLFNVDKVAPKGVSASDMLAYFPSGKLAMLIGPDYNIRAYSQLKDLHWDYAPYPYFKNGKPVTPTGSWSLGINKYSKNKQAAMKLIKFLTLTPACVDWFYMDGHLPTNKNTFTAIDNDSKFKEWPFNVFDLLTYESNNTAVPRPMTPGYLEYESILTNAFDDIRNGADIDTTLSNTEDQIDRSLAKYR